MIDQEIPEAYMYQSAPVLQRLNNAIHHMNRYPVNKNYQNETHFQLESGLSGGQRYSSFEQPGPDTVVWRLDNAIHQINRYQIEWTFEQPGPGLYRMTKPVGLDS